MINPDMPVAPDPRGRRKISPTDVSQFIRLEQCGRYLRLRLHERAAGRRFLEEYGVYPQSIPPLLTRSGSEFEQRTEREVRQRFNVLNFAADAARTTRPPDNARVLDLARSLPPGEVLVLFQVRLEVTIGAWLMRGDMDILRMERNSDGALHLLIADMKSSASAKVEFRLQVAFYHAMLAALLEEAGVGYSEIKTGILYRGEVNAGKEPTEDELATIEAQRMAAWELLGVKDSLLELIPDPEAYLESVSDLVAGPDSTAERLCETSFEELPYHLTYKCDGCIYNEFCMKWSAERDDLSLVPHLTGVDKEALRRAGVRTVRDLAMLKEFRGAGSKADAYRGELVPAPGKEALARKLAAAWPVGPRVDELVYRARYYRSRWKKDPIEARSYLPSKGHGSLPYCDLNHNPNLVRIYIDAQHDYLHDRIYMLGALVVACEGGEEKPERRRSVVHLTDGPPDTPEKEEQLFLGWIEDVLRAVVELAAPDENGEQRAPIHLIFFNRYEQQVLLDGLGRHLPSVLGATPMYDFITQQAAFDSPIATFLDEEIRELKNYPMVCQSLQSVAAFLKFDWRRERDYREIFKERLFDFWAQLAPEDVPGGESPWYTSKARFKSEIPLEYVYAAWNELAPPEPDDTDLLKPYRGATPDLLREFEALRLEAVEHITRDFKGNYLTQKTSFRLPDIAGFVDKADSLARALQEFVTIERHVELGAWKSARNMAPERRVLMGETLLARYLEADQEPEVAERNRDAAHRVQLKAKYEQEYLAANPDVQKVPLTREQKDQTKWSLEGLPFVLRLETAGVDADLDEVLALSTLRDGDRVVIYPRVTHDKRLPADQRTDNTPTPKQMLYGQRADIQRIQVERDDAGRATSARVELVMSREMGTQKGFLFSSTGKQPLVAGALYTLDSDPSDIYGYWCAVVAEGLCNLEEAGNGELNTMYHRLAHPTGAQLDLPSEMLEGQERFLAGLQALYEAGACPDFEPSKRDYIGRHAADPILLVQGPPGTGKSFSTAYAILARLQGAMSAGKHFRVLVSCKTHAATDVLIEKLAAVQREMHRWSESHPALFARYFDPRLLELPLMRVAPKHHLQGVTLLAKDGGKDRSEPRNADIIASHPWCVVAATPGGIYSMVKAKWDKDLFGHFFSDCLVLDEASQMNLPESAMSALPLSPGGQIIVVGDPRQMPPIVKHNWSNERRRTFQEYKTYQSLFDTLLGLDPAPPMIKFAESFRLHADIAEFLRREIDSKDGIDYFSRKDYTLDECECEDPFVAAVLSPSHPIVVVVHDEAQSQTRNPFEQRLIGPVLTALADPTLYGLGPMDGLGVVVPHRAQRADLQNTFTQLRELDEETNAVRVSAVDTVERFQGGERTAILVSATESDRDYLLAASDFLYDPRRLTVAISRAKRKMVLVAARSIFSLFSPDEEAFANAQLWKNLLRRTCTDLLWEGEREGVRVQVWGNGHPESPS